jgi:clan AA aspartic protease (TIGR02281 family)
MNKALLALVGLLLVAGVATYGDRNSLQEVQHAFAAIEDDVTGSITGKSSHGHTTAREVQIGRGHGGQFAVQAQINGVATPMVIDTGASSVVLTYETAKAAGLPLELLDYDIELDTASGRTKAARLTLDRLGIGKVVERSVPALVVPQGQLKSNLLGMSFLDRLESWEVRADRLVLRGYP